MEALEKCQFVFDVQYCVPAVDDVKGTFGECPLSGVSHLKLDLR